MHSRERQDCVVFARFTQFSREELGPLPHLRPNERNLELVDDHPLVREDGVGWIVAESDL